MTTYTCFLFVVRFANFWFFSLSGGHITITSLSNSHKSHCKWLIGFAHFRYPHICLLQPAFRPCLRYPRGSCSWKKQTGRSERAGARGDSRRRALSSWWTWAAAGSGAAGWRKRHSAVSNKWLDYPITSLSTSVRQQDMARCKINRYHLAKALHGRVIVRLIRATASPNGGNRPCALQTARNHSHASWTAKRNVAQHSGHRRANANQRLLSEVDSKTGPTTL